MLNHNLAYWVWRGALESKNASYIWHSLLKAKPWLCGNLRWVVGRGNRIAIGLDAIKGFSGDHLLSLPILQIFYNSGIKTLAHIWNRRSFAFPPSCWPSSQDLGFPTDLEPELEHYRYMLGRASIVLNDKEDHLAWGGRKFGGNILVQDVYSYITQDLRTAHCEAWLADMWRWEAPLKPLLSWNASSD